MLVAGVRHDLEMAVGNRTKRGPRRQQTSPSTRSGRERTARIIVAAAMALAAIVLLVILWHGDTQTEGRILTLVEYVVTTSLGAGLTFLFGRTTPSRR
jgi:hypothetical protein